MAKLLFPIGELPQTGFVRQSRLIHVLAFSSSTLWRKVKAGTFPRPVKLSARITAWRLEEIHQWINSRATEGSVAPVEAGAES